MEARLHIFHETFDGNATFLPLGNEEEARKKLLKSGYVMVNDDFSIPFDVMEKRSGQLFNKNIGWKGKLRYIY